MYNITYKKIQDPKGVKLKVVDKNIVNKLKEGKIGVLPTDTVYGIHASALKPEAVKRVYKLKEREEGKPFIILVSDIADLENYFGIGTTANMKDFLENTWPARLSVIFPVKTKKLKYLHRGMGSLAFRLPAKSNLVGLIKKTGPLISTTVNVSGEVPAKNIKEAKKLFGDRLDFYVDEGDLEGKSSTLIKFENGEPVVLRQGDYKVK